MWRLCERLSHLLFSSRHYKCIRRRALEEKILLCFGSAKMALPDSTGPRKPSRWILILTQCRTEKLVLERLSTFCKSAPNISYSAIASRDHSACVFHTVQHAHSAYIFWCGNHCSAVQCSAVQCSVLCFDPASFVY